MSPAGWVQVLVFLGTVALVTPPLGTFLHRVMEGQDAGLTRPLGFLERAIDRLCGVDGREQSWRAYSASLFAFSAVGLLVVYAIQRCQAWLPLNPQHLGPVEPALAFNTAASFVSNTNWQAYAGETTLSHLTQMAALGWQNFVSAAAGLAVAMALARGLTRHGEGKGPAPIGNFWKDLNRATVYVLLPLSLVAALVFASRGVVQGFEPNREIRTLEGGRQVLPFGPVASQEAIKQLGTNGGGFFNANASHPFENPDPVSSFLSLVLIFAIPSALTFSFGRMARNPAAGWALFGVMSALFLAGVAVASWAESQGNPVTNAVEAAPGAGNLEGKETRFGVAGSALYAVVTTDASCGAVNAMHDSFTPLGGLVLLFDIQLGEVVFGGVGAGLYGMLVMAVLAVFIAGLMVGRTPEYLGKKLETREVQLAMLYALIFPLLVLAFSAVSVVSPDALGGLGNPGPHGLSEILYAYTSAVGNNGSAFAGLNANTPWYDWTLGLAMLAGRFLMMLPVLALAGSLAGKKVTPAGPGTLPSDGLLFSTVLLGVVVIVGALTFFPALSLGPILEHFLASVHEVF